MISAHRRILAGGVAVLALAATTSGASTLVAQAQPNSVTIDGFSLDSPENAAILDWAETGTPFRGSTSITDPAEVTVFDAGAEATLCTAAVDAGAWECTSTNSLIMGTRAYSASLTTDSAQYSVGFDLTVRPAQPGYTTGDPTIVAGGQVVFAGTTTAPDVTVSVAIDSVGSCSPSDEGGVPIVFATVGEAWSCSIDDVPFTGPGSYPVDVWQTHEETGTPGAIRTATLTIGVPGGLDCAFGPSAVTITAPGSTAIGVYTLLPRGDDSGWVLAPQGYCNAHAGYRDPSVPSWDDTPYPEGSEGGVDCSTGCELTDLAPGIYEISYSDNSAWADKSAGFDYLFRIPETPTLLANASSATYVALTGTATAGDTVRVVDGTATTLCTTSATRGGRWACEFPKSSATSARAVALDPQSGGMSGYASSVQIPIATTTPTPTTTPPAAPPTPTATPPTAPPLVSAPLAWVAEFPDLSDLKPGDTFTIRVANVPADWTIEVLMHSTPRSLGSVVSTGAPVVLELTVPENIENGAHRIEVVATTPLGTTSSQIAAAFVTDGLDPAQNGDHPSDDPGQHDVGEGTPSAGSGDRADPATPSAITDSLPTIERILRNPATIAVAGGLALALLLLIALPTELLNNSLASNTGRLGRLYGAVDEALIRAQDWFVRVTRSRAVGAAIITVAVAIVYGFIDPAFGFDLVSLRLVASLALAFFLLSYMASGIAGLIVKRTWGVEGTILLQPSIILFAILGVVLARLLDFSPGFLVGIAIGLELVRASKAAAARAVLVQFVVVLVVAFGAWVAYSVYTPEPDFVGLMIQDTLVAVTAEGLTGALIAIFPLRFMDGRELWQASKLLWGLVFMIVATAFALLVLPTAMDGTTITDYGVWIAVVAGFGVLTLGIWLMFVAAARRDEAEQEAEQTQKAEIGA